MTIEQILELGKMGYTKDEIAAMQEPKQEPKQEPTQEPIKEPEPQQEPQKEPAPQQEPQKEPAPTNAPDNNAKFLDDLNKTLSGFIADLQKQNIMNSNNAKNNTETAEQILGNIIMPPLKKGDK